MLFNVLFFTMLSSCHGAQNPTNGLPPSGDGAPGYLLVDPAALKSGDGLTWATALKTIQEAIDKADNEKPIEVRLASGNYDRINQNNPVNNVLVVIFEKKKITITGGYDPKGAPDQVPDPKINVTQLDGSGANSPIEIESSEDISIKGVTITNGGKNSHAVRIVFSKKVSLSDSSIIKNPGGGISFRNTTEGQISACIFSNNKGASFGGAIDVEASTLTLDQTSFEQNQAQFRGHSIYLNNGSIVIIKDVDKMKFDGTTHEYILLHKGNNQIIPDIRTNKPGHVLVELTKDNTKEVKTFFPIIKGVSIGHEVIAMSEDDFKKKPVIKARDENGNEMDSPLTKIEKEGREYLAIQKLTDNNMSAVELFLIPTEKEYRGLKNIPISDDLAQFKSAFQKLNINIEYGVQIDKDLMIPEQGNFDPSHDRNWWRTIYHGDKTTWGGNKLSAQALDIPFKEGFIFSITRQISVPATNFNSKTEKNPWTGKNVTTINEFYLKQHANNIAPFIAQLEQDYPDLMLLGRMYQQLKVQEEKKKDDVLTNYIDQLSDFLIYCINLSYRQYQDNKSVLTMDNDLKIYIEKETNKYIEYGVKILSYFENPIPFNEK